MINKLKIKAIYDDFLANVKLTDEQIRILDMMIKKETRYKMSAEIGVCERTIGYEVQKIKELYKNYCELQITKANLLMK